MFMTNVIFAEESFESWDTCLSCYHQDSMVIIDNGELLKLPCGLCRLSNSGADNCDEEEKTQQLDNDPFTGAF